MSLFQNLPNPRGNPFGNELEAKMDDHILRADLTIGMYTDSEGKPFVFQTVREAEEILITKEGAGKYYQLSLPNKWSIPSDGKLDKSYAGFKGMKEFRNSSLEMLLGNNSKPVKEERVMSIHTSAGSGGIRLIMEFLNKFYPERNVYVSNITFPLHNVCYESITRNSKKLLHHRYYDLEKYCFDFEGMVEDFSNKIEPGSIVLLHGCAHNPTGMDPTPSQWDQLIAIMKQRNIFPFVDIAYQGMVTGDPDKDAYSVRKMVEEGLEVFVTHSFSKSMGLYGERVGCVHVVSNSKEKIPSLYSEFENLSIELTNFVPVHGARLVTFILQNPDLRNKWRKELEEAAIRIQEMRKRLYEELCVKRKTPEYSDWKCLLEGKGMFFLPKLSPKMVETMGEKFHVYVTPYGRIAINGLNEKNIENVANAIDFVKRNC